MMDVLFRAQETLFRLRDPRRPTYADNEDELETARASSEGALADPIRKA
jgi:hypothetical protein